VRNRLAAPQFPFARGVVRIRNSVRTSIRARIRDDLSYREPFLLPTLATKVSRRRP
jgi:hypothetical protein